MTETEFIYAFNLEYQDIVVWAFIFRITLN